MRIVFTGGGSGGHFYPIIAVAESVRNIADKEKILDTKLYYYSDSPYDKESLFETGIKYTYIPAGKLRIYRSTLNIIDMFKTLVGAFQALVSLFFLYPDVVFCKGGYGSFPVVLAARILRIPVVVHESDTVPGRVNKWAGKFAKHIAVSYDETVQYFPKDKVVHTGQPIREIIKEKKPEGAFEYLKLDSTIPTILILGGSLGAEAINNIVIDSLMQLLPNYQIIHQTGINNFKDVKARAEFLTRGTSYEGRYLAFPFLNPLAMKMAAGAASLVVSRAGSTIFEIASWGIPSIIIPITTSYDDHQRKNAYNYASHGAAEVIQEGNLSPAILLTEIKRCLSDKERNEKMRASAKSFASPDAAERIARLLVDMSLRHEN
ncbi:MAG: UDP-N-acetylglucosamine--N-acetylmuramyl-(pentapeptide) pyrophosphoryl-undecaprenol N-acetylglucosamine transferase [Candidatus Pacebacteria bacterium]|nr:UDP-N-acetylglucosamine--N-acetylmuramyl-(pentapeptide) pyrophosphoryl-undecaprenol N-acetylglucosamine transferase [Candidatus Paceibacterota bacterium]